MLASAPWSLAWWPKAHYHHLYCHFCHWPLIITIIFFVPSGASSATTEAVGTRLTAAEVAASSVPAVFSSDASLSSSESSRMMTLPSLGGPRMSQLWSPKSFLANSASREVSAMKFSSSEYKERSIIGAFPEEPSCSKTSEQGQQEEIFDGDPGGGGDPDGVDGGVLVSLGKGFPSGEGERSCLMPRKEMGDGSRWGTNEIFIAERMPYCYSNGCHHVFRASNQ
jgi:hypothetical protein